MEDRSAIMEVCIGCSTYTWGTRLGRWVERRKVESMGDGFLEEMMLKLSLKDKQQSASRKEECKSCEG